MYRYFAVTVCMGAFLAFAHIAQAQGDVRTECTTEGVVTNCRTVGAGTFSEVWDRAEQLKARPVSDDAAVIAELRADGDGLAPPLYLELARRTLSTDPAEAAYLLQVGFLRMRYDGARCSDNTAAQGQIFFQQLFPELSELFGNDDLRIAAYRRMREEGSLFTGTHSAWWICSHGIRAGTAAMFGRQGRGDQEFLVSDERAEEIRGTMGGALDTWIEDISANQN